MGNVALLQNQSSLSRLGTVQEKTNVNSKQKQYSRHSGTDKNHATRHTAEETQGLRGG
jgi:hypothetical protein